MRKLLWSLAAAVLASALWAQEIPENQRWIEQIDGGVVVPASPSAAGDYDLGFGGDILVGYRFSRDFSLSADLGYYDCDEKLVGGAEGEWIYVPVLGVARWTVGSGWVRPYFLMGAGVAFNSYNLTKGPSGKVGKQETDLLLSPGAGVLFIVAPGMALYLQGRLDMNFSTPSAPWPDNPTLFLPLKGGLSLFVL